jgi:hypothetical protein
MKLKLFWKMLKSYIRYSKEAQLRDVAIGMNSFIDREHNIHLLMLDYDEVSYERVESSVKEIQSFWKLSDAFIYKTRRGHHVIFYFDHMPYSRVKMIINFARDIDEQFRYISRYYSYKTLRVCGKYQDQDIQFKTIIPGIRQPTLVEVEKGSAKKMEHDLLMGFHPMINKDILKS